MELYEKAEVSIVKKYRSKIWIPFISAVKKYRLIVQFYMKKHVWPERETILILKK